MPLKEARAHSLATVLVVAACLASLLCSYEAAAKASSPALHNHIFYFGEYGGPSPAADGARRIVPPDTRYVQLSNGSRFVCDTTDFRHHDPPAPHDFPLDFAIQSIVDSIKKSSAACTHVSEEQHVTVLCWDREVRHDTLSPPSSRVLGRHNETNGQHYRLGEDAFGPYVAITYDNGEECVYTSKPIETELRFYCRYTELENPIPFLTMHEAAQCRYVLRVMSNKFCFVPMLDHAIETETVHCRMLE